MRYGVRSGSLLLPPESLAPRNAVGNIIVRRQCLWGDLYCRSELMSFQSISCGKLCSLRRFVDHSMAWIVIKRLTECDACRPGQNQVQERSPEEGYTASWALVSSKAPNQYSVATKECIGQCVPVQRNTAFEESKRTAPLFLTALIDCRALKAKSASIECL